MLDLFGGIILGIEFILIIFIILFSYKNKIIFSKKNIMYFTPVFLICTSLYIIGIYYETKTIDIFTIADSICYGIYAFAFRLDRDLVGLAVNDSLVFSIAYTISVLLSGVTMISTVVGLLRMNITNSLNITKMKRKNADIVIGYCENSMEYVKKNKNSILWVDANEKKLTNEEKTKLFNKKIAVINKPFDKDRLRSLLLFRKGIIHFIVFTPNKDKMEYTKYIEAFTNENISTKATVFLHIEAKNEYINFVNTQMSYKAVNSNYELIATCFNVHELLARRFIIENNYIDYLPKDFLEEGILKKDINVFFIGFGKTNFSIFKSCLLNNQFVTIKDDKFYNKQVNYYLYDLYESTFNNELIARLNMDYANKKIDKEVPPIEKICNLNFEKMNIKSNDFISKVNSIIKKDSHNIFFISFSEGIENASFAEILEHYFGDKSIHIYYNVDSSLEVLKESSNKNLTPFGFKNTILNHSIIANDSLADQARKVNKKYHSLNKDDLIKWEKLPVIEKYSNVYNAINLRFKIQMMGLNYDDYLNDRIDKNEYESILFKNKSKEDIVRLKEYQDYQEYFNINLRTALAFQEHLRWVAYYYANNFDQMKTKKIKFINNKLIIKDMDDKRHSCITSYYGLDVLHHKMLELYKENGVEKNIYDVETYKYDFMTYDNLI